MVELGARNIRGCRPSARYQKYYDKVNKIYFDGALPHAKVYTAPLLKITKMSQKEIETSDKIDGGEYGVVGYDANMTPCIILDKGTAIFHSLITKQTVIHEAIHFKIGFNRGHGKYFKKEVRRVAALGAFDELI